MTQVISLLRYDPKSLADIQKSISDMSGHWRYLYNLTWEYAHWPKTVSRILKVPRPQLIRFNADPLQVGHNPWVSSISEPSLSTVRRALSYVTFMDECQISASDKLKPDEKGYRSMMQKFTEDFIWKQDEV